MNIIAILFLLLFLVIFPIMLGLLIYPNDIYSLFPTGFFIELAVFQLLEFPFAFFGWSLRLLSLVFIFVLIVLACIAIKRNKFDSLKSNMKDIWNKLTQLTKFEWIYLVVFLGLLFYQVYGAIRYDLTVNSYDDNWYVTWAADSVRTDKILRVDYNTGVGTHLNIHRSMQSYIMFPAMLAIFSGVPVIVIEHMIMQVFLLLLAYSIYFYMSIVLFKEKDNALIFLIFISLVYIFGSYSHYSTSFRLLGPNYQGKAVLAVSITPFVFALLFRKLEQDYERFFGILLLLLSLAATACSLIGTVTIVVNVSIPIVLNMFTKNRNPKHLLYIVWSGIMPVFYFGLYVYFKFYV